MDRLEATQLAAYPPRNDGRHFRVECLNVDGSAPLPPPSQVTTDSWTVWMCSARGRLPEPRGQRLPDRRIRVSLGAEARRVC
jgi:hypothetical protein